MTGILLVSLGGEVGVCMSNNAGMAANSRYRLGSGAGLLYTGCCVAWVGKGLSKAASALRKPVVSEWMTSGGNKTVVL
jgi:hypothetical protein